MTLTPAYGRDYKSRIEIAADLNAPKDFIINDPQDPYDGKPCLVNDLGLTEVKVRYSNLRKEAMFVKGENGWQPK